MAVIEINLNSLKTVTYNGLYVKKLFLDGEQIWEEPLTPEYQFSYFGFDMSSYVGQTWNDVIAADPDHFFSTDSGTVSTAVIFIPNRGLQWPSQADYWVCRTAASFNDSFVTAPDTVTGEEFLIVRARGKDDDDGDDTIVTIYVGDNSVKANAEGIKHKFTAKEEGDYEFNSTDGNAFLGYLEDESGDEVVYPDEMPIVRHLSAGESFIILCSTQDFADSEYVLNVSKLSN